MADMMNDMLTSVGPQQEQQMQQPQQQQQPASMSEAIKPMVQDATSDFMHTFISIIESHGLSIDDLMSNKPSVLDQADSVDANADPLEILNREELMILVGKFEAIEPDMQNKMIATFKKELHPATFKMLETVRRFGNQGMQG